MHPRNTAKLILLALLAVPALVVALGYRAAIAAWFTDLYGRLPVIVQSFLSSMGSTVLVAVLVLVVVVLGLKARADVTQRLAAVNHVGVTLVGDLGVAIRKAFAKHLAPASLASCEVFLVEPLEKPVSPGRRRAYHPFTSMQTQHYRVMKAEDKTGAVAQMAQNLRIFLGKAYKRYRAARDVEIRLYSHAGFTNTSFACQIKDISAPGFTIPILAGGVPIATIDKIMGPEFQAKIERERMQSELPNDGRPYTDGTPVLVSTE